MLWCMHRTNIYLEDRQTEALDKIASQLGLSRAQVIRDLVDRTLNGEDRDITAGVDAINRSAGALADIEPMEREPDARQSYLGDLIGLSAEADLP